MVGKNSMSSIECSYCLQSNNLDVLVVLGFCKVSIESSFGKEARLGIAVLLTSTYQLLFSLRGRRLVNQVHGSGRK